MRILSYKLRISKSRSKFSGGIFVLWGIVFSIVAGMAMSVQGVMNTRLGEGIGNTEANVFVQGTAFLLAAAVLLFHRDGSFTELGQVNKLYWLGGVLGIVITLTVMLGIKSLGTTVAISVILISQLLVAALIDAFGLMGSEKLAFSWTKYAGLALMIGGMLLFRYMPKA
ncbi:MAG: DMT family transporter [Oscillospiraceae bacterium]|nr:DMT family transporter [Oscillospiraceae bacterium]